MYLFSILYQWEKIFLVIAYENIVFEVCRNQKVLRLTRGRPTRHFLIQYQITYNATKCNVCEQLKWRPLKSVLSKGLQGISHGIRQQKDSLKKYALRNETFCDLKKNIVLLSSLAIPDLSDQKSTFINPPKCMHVTCNHNFCIYEM